MAKVYKRTDIAENDIYGGITESAEKALVKVEAVDKQIVLFTEHYKALLGVTNTDTIQGIEQLKKISADLNKQTVQTIQLERDKAKIEQLNIKLKSDEIRLSNQQLKSEQQRARAIKKTSLEQAILNEKQRQANAQTKAIAQLRASETNSLDALNAKMKLIETAYNRLTPAQIENTKQGQRYLASLTAVRAEISKQQQAYGKHNLDVGNYKKAFDGLGFSVSQLAREMPAFANSMQTGFMAISNNLPMFFDEINKIKQANKELQATGQPTVSVFKQVAKSIFSVSSLLSIGVTLLTVYGAKVVEWLSGSKKSSEQLKKEAEHRKRVNEELNRGNVFVGQESALLVANLTALKHTNAGSKERAKLIKDINSNFGLHLKNLKDEAIFQAEVNRLIFEYIQYQRLAFRAKKNMEIIEKSIGKQEALFKSLRKELGISQKTLDKITAQSDGFEILFQTLSQGIAPVTTLTTQLGLTEKEAQKLVRGYEDLRKQDEKNIQTNIKEEEAREGALNALKETVGWTDEYVALSENQSKQVLSNIQRIDRLNGVITAYSINLSDVNGSMEKYQFHSKGASKSNQEQAKSWEAINTQLEQLDKYKEYVEFARELSELDFNLANIANEADIQKAGENITKILEEQKQAIEEGRAYDSQLLDEAINYEFEAKKRQYERLRDFKLQQLNEDFSEEKKARFKAIEDETSELLKVADEQRLELLKQQNLTDAQLLEINKQYQKSVDEIGKSRLKKIDDLNEIYIDKEKLKSKEEQLIVANTNSEIEQLNEEKNNKIISQNDELIDAEIQQAEKSNEEKNKIREDEAKAEEEHQERMADFRKKMIESGLDAWKEASQEREKLIDREIDASQKLADQLGEQAKNGTIQANQSLAEQNRITNERLQAKQKEQRFQQQIEEIKLLYSATEQYLADGDTLPVAGAKAFLQVKGIKALAQSLVGFFTGTEKTIGEELGAPQLSGKDGHIVRVDGSEMVMNGGLVQKARSIDPNVTTSEIVNGFIKSKTSNVAPIYVSNSTSDSVLVSEIRDLKKVIERKPEIQMDASRITDNLFEFTTTTKKGADLIKNRHIYRKQ